MFRAILIGACFLFSAGLASASTTFALCGTGFTNDTCTTQVTTTNGTGVDGNWTLESAPTPTEDGCNGTCVASVPTGVLAPVTETGQAPFGTGGWLGDTTSSEWISPFGNENSGDSDPNSCTSAVPNCTSPVPYVYQDTFNLTGYNLSTVTITGQWAADNFGFIVVNGVQVSVGSIADADGQFESFTSFALNSSNTTFVAGVNTIDFDVFNNINGGPDVTGLNVNIESDFASAAPEPSSLGMLGLGLAALGVGSKKLRRR
jgi:hypothetical protein